MSRSWINVWILILVHGAGYNYSFRALLASQEAAPTDGCQGQAAELYQGGLGGPKPDTEGYQHPTITPFQVYFAGQSTSETGAATWAAASAPARCNNVSSLVHSLRGQSLYAGLLLPSVRREAPCVHSTAAGSSLDVNGLEQRRFASPKALSQMPLANRLRAQAAGCTCQPGQGHAEPCPRRAEGQRQVRDGQDQAGGGHQAGTSSRILDRTLAEGCAAATGGLCGIEQGAKYRVGPTCQCREECTGQPCAGACSKTRGLACVNPGDTGDPLPGSHYGQSQVATPRSFSAAARSDRVRQGSVGQASVFKWLAPVFVPAWRFVGQTDGGASFSVGRLRPAGTTVGNVTAGGGPHSAGASGHGHSGGAGNGLQHGSARSGGGAGRDQGCGGRCTGEDPAATTRATSNRSQQSAASSTGGQGQGRIGCSGSCGKRTRSYTPQEASREQGRLRGTNHRPRGRRSPWQGPELSDAQWRVTSGRTAWHSVILEPDYVSPSLALVIGRALAFQVLCGGEEQTLDPRICSDSGSFTAFSADSTAPGFRGFCRRDWGCTWDSAGLLAPADFAAPGALDDCSVHSGERSYNSEDASVQLSCCGPNPCYPRHNDPGHQVSRLPGARIAGSTAPKVRGFCRREWGCALDRAGPFVPADSAALGALEDCSVHSGERLHSSGDASVQLGCCSPNPCNPCSGNTGAQVLRLAGIRRFPTPASSQASKLAGRCVHFEDAGSPDQPRIRALLWLQVSRAVRRMPGPGSCQSNPGRFLDRLLLGALSVGHFFRSLQVPAARRMSHALPLGPAL